MARPIYILMALCCLCVQDIQAQNFQDSLKGFDEVAAIRASVSENFSGDELGIHMQQLKRNYINNKYGLKKAIQWSPLISAKTSSAACVNEDFESSTAGSITSSTQISGWTVSRGNNQNGNDNCNLNGCCTSNPSEAVLISAASGYTDPVIGNVYPIYSVFGSAPAPTAAAAANPQITSPMYGSNFIRINSNTPDYSLERVSKSFVVSSSNAMFSFAFIGVQSAGHTCCDAGGFILRITNVTTNTFLSALSYSASGYNSACTGTLGISYLAVGSGTPAGSGTYLTFNKWHVNNADLSPYIGQTISIEVTAGDCTAGGHFAYAYFDAQCGPMEILVDGQGKNKSCNTTATVSAPANINAYQWNGPAGFTSSAQSFTTITPGVYSLSIPQNLPYSAIEKTLSLVISPANVTVSATPPVICKGEKSVLNGGGLSTYAWSGGGGNPSKTVTPTSTTTYTLTGSNSDNCPGFAMLTVTVNTCSGIENNQAAETIQVYPNPNNGDFSVKLPADVKDAEILILNTLGQLVYSQKMKPGENTINAKTLSTGIYYYSVVAQDRVLTQNKLKIE